MNRGKAEKSCRKKTALALKKRCVQKNLSDIGVLLTPTGVSEDACNLFQREKTMPAFVQKYFLYIQYMGPKFWPFCSLCNIVISKEGENWPLYRHGNIH